MSLNKKVVRDYLRVEFYKDLFTIQATLFQRPFNGYLGWTGYGNLGDEAVFDGYRNLFSKSKLVTFRIARPSKSFSSFFNLKIPLSSAGLGGGTIINQSKTWYEQSKYLIEHKIPMYCMGTGVASRAFWKNHEEIHTANDIDKWAQLLKKFIYVGVRGPLSQKALATAGLPVEIVGDAALSLTKPTYTKKTEKKIIGINISFGADSAMWGDGESVQIEIIKFIKISLEEGHEVHLLPIWNDDLKTSEKILHEINDARCTLVRAYGSTSEYMAALDNCDLFVGLKLHSTIFATMLRIPSIMLEYRPKCLDYMQSIGMEKYCIRTDELTSVILLEKFNDLKKNYSSVVSSIDEKVMFYKNLQEKRALEIQDRLKTTI